MAAGRERDWHKFQEKIKEKRVATGKEKKAKGKGAAAVPDDNITVQRLCAEVSGKLQKYSRIGAREFMPYEFEEYTINNIKSACMKYFGIPDDGLLCCDVLAGEQGPSCLSVKQIPDFKVIHVRFIERTDGGPEAKRSRPEGSPARQQTRGTATQSLGDKTSLFSHPRSIQLPKMARESRIIPKSLSVVDMLKLSNQIKRTATALEIYTFDLKGMTWSGSPVVADFKVEEKSFGVGGFRKAFKATCKHKEYTYTSWVLKRYLPKSLEDIKILEQTPEQHTKKAVQLHYLAKNFAAQLREDLEREDNLVLFGDTMSYNKVMFGYIRAKDEYVTVEEFVNGTFDKYFNNDGAICVNDKNLTEKAECLAHYSYQKSKKEIMVLGIQGCGVQLFDPEIASSKVQSENEEQLFCTGNLHSHAIDTFVEEHKCKSFCQLLDLAVLRASSRACQVLQKANERTMIECSSF